MSWRSEQDIDWRTHQQINAAAAAGRLDRSLEEAVAVEARAALDGPDPGQLLLVKTEAGVDAVSFPGLPGFADHNETFGLAEQTGYGFSGNRYVASDAGSSQATTTAERLTESAEPAVTATKRRMRSIKSCLECRRRKLKCTKSQPCRNCAKADRLCLYLGHDLDALSKMQINGIKEKVARLDRELEKTARSQQRLQTGVPPPEELERLPLLCKPLMPQAQVVIRSPVIPPLSPFRSGSIIGTPRFEPSPLVAEDVLYEDDDHAEEESEGGDADENDSEFRDSEARNQPCQNDANHSHESRIGGDSGGFYGYSQDMDILEYADDEGDTMSANEMVDLGIRVGRMRITEGIGGLNQSQLADVIKMSLSGRAGYRASGSRRSDVSDDAFSSNDDDSNDGDDDDDDSDSDGGEREKGRRTTHKKSGNVGNIPDFLLPSDDYITPTGSLCCGPSATVPPVQQMLQLPPPAFCHQLIQKYASAVHPVAPCLHWPSFAPQFTSFIAEAASRGRHRPPNPPRPSLQALVCAVLFSAAVATNEAEAAAIVGSSSLPSFSDWASGGFRASSMPAAATSRARLIRAVQCGLEASLTAADFLRTTRIETLQAFVLYLVTLCRAEVSRAHSVLVGAAIRMAECMGLHRDGEAFGLTPLEVHIRRLLWHQLCFLDIRTCEAQGPWPLIRAEDYDTQLPLNCREEDLQLTSSRSQPSSPPSSRLWTPMLLVVIRFEINEMMRIVWNERRRLEARRTSLAAVVTKVEQFRRSIFAKYEPLLEVGESDTDTDSTSASRRYARLVMQLLVFRLHVMVLHPYHSNTATPLNLMSILLMSGVMIVETAAQIESNPVFAPWRWYRGAYQQYQVALLLATEVFFRPDSPFRQRIWRCLHFVFEVDPTRPSREKSKAILRDIMHKTAVYTQQRRMRVPTTLTQQAPPQGGKRVDKTEQLPVDAVPTRSAATAASSNSPRPVRDHKHEGHGQYRQQQQQPPPNILQQKVLEQHHGHHTQPMAASQGNFSSTQRLHTALPPSSAMPPSHLQMPLQPAVQTSLQASLQTLPPLPAPTPFAESMVFAGVTNGEALWGLPQSLQMGIDSPGDGGGGSDVGAVDCSPDAALFAPPAYPAHPPLQSMEGLIWDEFENMLATQPVTRGLWC